MSNFQIAVVGVFIALAILGVIVFAGFGGTNKVAIPSATVWGTVPGIEMAEVIKNINGTASVANINYVEKNAQTYESDLVNAIAEGKGPDVVMISDDMLMTQKGKLYPIPYASLSERTFRDTYLDEGEIFLAQNGILAVPFSVDPMVMYWNRDIITSAGIAKLPNTWADIANISNQIIKKTDTNNITTSLVPFGEWKNVNNAKQIIATLLFQAGNYINIKDSNDQVYSVLDQISNNSVSATGEAVLDYYTAFADPSKSTYSWNTSLPDSFTAFLSGNLATYFGYASELNNIRSKNPNLNFDISAMPQQNPNKKILYGKITGLAITKSSKSPADAFAVIQLLTNQSSVGIWSKLASLPPVRRDLLTQKPGDAFMSVFYDSAIQSKAWLDPSPTDTNEIFRNMVESVTTGKSTSRGSISNAKAMMDNLINSLKVK